MLDISVCPWTRLPENATFPVGASFVFVTAKAKVSETLAALPSVAVTLTSTEPTSALAGVPLNVRAKASKESQDGRAASFDNAAV